MNVNCRNRKNEFWKEGEKKEEGTGKKEERRKKNEE
jgi:hypothetical protein